MKLWKIFCQLLFLGLCLGCAQSSGVEAAVHVSDFTGDAAGQIAAQEGGGVAHFFDGHIAFERRVLLVVAEQFAEWAMPAAASVLISPAGMPFTRIPLRPGCIAR